MGTCGGGLDIKIKTNRAYIWLDMEPIGRIVHFEYVFVKPSDNSALIFPNMYIP